MAGQPVRGETLQEGGLELQLTLLNATTMQPLSDIHKPARTRTEGLLAETKAGRKVRLELPLTMRLTESCHTFKFFVLLLSSDIGGLMKIKVAPPNANAGDPLCVITREFLSRARSNVHEKKSTDQYRSLSGGDGDEGTVFRSVGDDDDDDGGMVFRSALNEDEDEDEEDEGVDEVEDEEDEEAAEDEEDEEAEAPTSSNQARTLDQLQQLLSGLENQQPMPSGPALLEALRMCWIGG